eukprot:CAMPEP_0114334982 /NCGR_PEP_ID=MMETSP0101-20121206/4748_1 /TAXON_ID=38822 ORGANISM="Pteridomonas danica, Strain PT" /NCGR_SAMPLE_ID=MMETSP0101 /ASSEMBLY_ACC=CAM_ASM_000211 /LENGTH=235 /DNA_ID=CAMNT_0001466443 /DNA_START=315 /DNA_END=1022 /DNA_ORIENTATION=-
MTLLKDLDLSRNHLSGTLEPVGMLVSLVDLNLGHNKLEGSLSAISNSKCLQRLVLCDNRLTGELHWLQGVTTLQVIDLSNNRDISGPLPPEFKQRWMAGHLPFNTAGTNVGSHPSLLDTKRTLPPLKQPPSNVKQLSDQGEDLSVDKPRRVSFQDKVSASGGLVLLQRKPVLPANQVHVLQQVILHHQKFKRSASLQLKNETNQDRELVIRVQPRHRQPPLQRPSHLEDEFHEED